MRGPSVVGRKQACLGQAGEPSGVVLEFLRAREDLTRARLSRSRAVVDFNRAKQDLKYAVGDFSGLEK